MQEGMTATNPQTGEKVVMRGGQWVPMGQAAQPVPAQPQQASPPSILIKPAPKPDPVEVQRDAIGLQRDQVALEKAQVDLQAAQTQSPNKDATASALSAVEALTQQVMEAERLYRQGPGATTGISGLTDYLPTDANVQFDTSGAQIGEMGLGAFRTPGQGSQSDREFQAFAEANRPNSWNRDAQNEQIFAGLKNRIDQRRKALGLPPADWSGTATQQEQYLTPQGRSPIVGISGGGTRQIATKEETGGTYSTEGDKKFAELVRTAFKNGANREQLDALAAKYGYPPYGPDLDEAIRQRQRGGIVMFQTAQSGKRDVSARQAAVGEFMSSPTGATLAGVGNGLLLGGLDEVGGAARSLATGAPLDQSIAEADLMKQIIAEQNPTAYTLGNIGGGAASGFAATAGATRMGLAQGGNILSPGAIATDVALGTVAGGLENNQNRLGGAGMGAVAGVAGGVTGRTAGKAIAPTGGQSVPLYDAGVRPTPGQRFGGVVNWAEETMGSVPFVGGAIRGARQKARDQFETGAFNNALGEIGLKLPKGVQNGADAHRFAQKRFSEAYEKAREGLVLVRDEKFVDDYKVLAEEIAGGGLTEQSAKRFQTIVKDVIDRRMPNGRMDGAALKQVQSSLGKRIAALRNAPSGDAELADALGELSTIIDDAARRSSTPEAVAALDAADRGYAQLVRIETAAGMGGIDEAGRFMPKDYARAVRKEAGGRATRSKAYLRGDALGQEYADAGLRLADRVPNSGTAERAATLAAVGGAGYMAPQTLAIPVAAAIPYLPGARNVTNALLAPRTGMVGKVANPIGRTLSRASLAGPNALLLADQN